MTKGWKYESNRHALAARGIKTRIPTETLEHPKSNPCGYCLESEYCPGYGSCDKFKEYQREKSMEDFYRKLKDYFSRKEDTAIISNRILYGKEPEVDQFLSDIFAKVKPLYLDGGHLSEEGLRENNNVDQAINNILIRMNEVIIKSNDRGDMWVKFTKDLEKAVTIPNYEWEGNTRSKYINDPLGEEVRMDIEYLKSIARRQNTWDS